MSVKNPSPESTYHIDNDLREVVQLALDLGMPLLVTGEPGTGKTRLARYVAEEMLGAKLLAFYTKTTSKAKDLLYHYDALSHFRDAQIDQVKRNPMEYVEFHAMGKAIVEASQTRYVVLVDEIDKAPRDFPNDVLFEFEEMAFKVAEANISAIQNWNKKQQEYKDIQLDEQGYFRTGKEAANKPVLILTSNSEKNLPDAFLRRCVYHHINFPKKDTLQIIVEKNVSLTSGFSKSMLEAAVDHFLAIRQKPLRKKPATAELLAWVHVLKNHGLDVNEVIAGSDEALKNKLKRAYAILFKNNDDLKWAEDLVKSRM
ncbi:MAG: MoxR family ATPase [Bacteroidota bacterium]